MGETMRAAVMRDGVIAIEERPVPTPGPGEVLIRTRRCGICGSDLHLFHHGRAMVEGGAVLGLPVDGLRRGLSEGLVMGHEFVGELVEHGPQTQHMVAGGARVTALPFLRRRAEMVLFGTSPEVGGGFADYLIASETLLVAVPGRLPDDGAALIEPLAIAVHAVNRSAADTHDVALVIGCGPIGLLIIAELRRRGVERIIASDPQSERRALALGLGAVQAIDPSSISPFELARDHYGTVETLIFDNTGVPGMLHQIVMGAPPRAHIVVVGIVSGLDTLVPIVAVTKELRLDFVIYYSRAEFELARDVLSDGVFDWPALVTSVLELDDVPAAFTSAGGPPSAGKTMIDLQAN